MDERRYGLAHLVDALVAFQSGGGMERIDALSRALGLDPELVANILDGGLTMAPYQPDREAYARLLGEVVDALAVELSPFAGMLEAPAGVIRLYQHHGERIGAAKDAARDAVRDLGVDLLVFLLQVPRGYSVAAADHPVLAELFRDHSLDDF